MRIALISDWETQGGASVSASRLAEGLCRAGHQVGRIVFYGDGGEHAWQTLPLRAAPSRWASNRATRRLLGPRFRTRVEQKALAGRLGELLRRLQPDVVNLHNLHSAAGAGWSWELARTCLESAPVVWTLHDMWSFTGRCAYSYDCRKYLTGCDATCPTAGEYPALQPEEIGPAWEARRQLFRAFPQLAAVTPSRWLAQVARAGLWRENQVEVIPYGLPLDVYRPIRREAAREALGIEAEGPVLLAVAQDFQERRKGGLLLARALSRLAERPLTLVTLGSGQLPLSSERHRVLSLGYVQEERLKVLAYSASDLLVHPAPVDNLPNVVLEALACGTPVVGFPIGGIPDMVRSGLTGWVASDLSSEALAEALESALEELPGSDWRTRCRAIAEQEYSLERQAGRYLELFGALSNEHRG
jgi:glycosyltransferase involved in cell wall biosynthesis